MNSSIQGDPMGTDTKLITEFEKFYTILNRTVGGYSIDEFRKARADYDSLRGAILSNAELISKMPSFIRDCHTLYEFSDFIKSKGNTRERRAYLKKELGPANAFVYQISFTPGDEVISEILSHRERLNDAWEKALQRRATDPDGAITSARSLLETTFKHVLDEKGLQANYDNNTTLPDLCFRASNAIAIHPQSTTDDQLKKLFGSYISVVNALGKLRNAQGDAHGKSESDIKPEKRIAALAVNLSGSIAQFFISTLDESDI